MRGISARAFMATLSTAGRIEDAPKRACPTCEAIRKEGGFGPSHEGRKGCESGSIASGGSNAHCSCDRCF